MATLAHVAPAGTNPDETWVIVAAAHTLFALPSSAVQTMVIMPTVTAVPQTPEAVRGVINLRGQVLTLVDLRVAAGQVSLAEQTDTLCATLEQREEDHRHWLGELEKSVEEDRPFGLTTDPHKCAFGQWYDHFRTDDLLLADILKKLDAPHRAIHALAHQVEAAKQRHDAAAARDLIAHSRNTVLRELVDLFAALRGHLRSSTREIAIVVQVGRQKPFAIAVDKVDSTGKLQPEQMTELPATAVAAGNDFVSGVARERGDKRLILLLEVAALNPQGKLAEQAA